MSTRAVNDRRFRKRQRPRYEEANVIMNPFVASHLDAIRELCREYGVLRPEVFGSVCTDEFDLERSDINFLVESPDDYDVKSWLARHQEFNNRLAGLLAHPVDLVMTGALRNKWFRQLAAETRTVISDAFEVVEVA